MPITMSKTLDQEIEEYQYNINHLEEICNKHRKLCDCSQCQLLTVYSRMLAKLQTIKSYRTFTDPSLFVEIETALSRLTDWSQNAELSISKKAEIERISDMFHILYERKAGDDEQEDCDHQYHLSRTCGVQVCDLCGDHQGLAKCFCGWNLEPGERLEDDVDY